MGEQGSPVDSTGGSADSEGADMHRCDYCRLLLPDAPVTAEYAGTTYEFCSNTCRMALEESDRSFTAYHGFRQFQPGVTAMDAGLPNGMPRNTFVLLSSQSGTRDEAVQAELVWRTLQRDEPAVIVSFLDTPTSIVQEFVTFDWNVLPCLESGKLRILDCFTYRLEDAQGIVNRMNAFNRHLHNVVEGATTVVHDPTDIALVRSRLADCLDSLGMSDRGIVVVDSLMELGTLVQPVKAYDFVKGLRADVPKGRFVPVFAGATQTRDEENFPHDLEYMVDGIVDLRFTAGSDPEMLHKQLRIRKMDGVYTIPKWHTYEYTAGEGLVVFDAKQDVAENETAGGDTDGDTGDGVNDASAGSTNHNP